MRVVTLGRSGVVVTAVALGTASLAEPRTPRPDGTGRCAVDAAWFAGIRFFDTAPTHGRGRSEQRLGAALRDRPRHEYAVSTKVGGAGVYRSLAGSMSRLSMDWLDVVLIDIPEQHGAARVALRQTYPAVHELRDQGLVSAIGVCSRHTALLTRFVTDADVDTVMLAGRYTLLDQSALDDLLPACARRGIPVLNADVFHGALLAVDRRATTEPRPPEGIPAPLPERARRIARLCRRHGVSLPGTAFAFAAAHPVVASVVVDAGTPRQVARVADLATRPSPPADLWSDLVAARLLRPEAPVPA